MIRLYLGRKERGKTTLMVYMVLQLLAGRRPVPRVIWDPRGMIRRPGAVVARTVEGFDRGMGALADGEVLELVYTPADHLDVAFPVFARAVKAWVDDDRYRPLAVVVDEITFVMPTAGNMDPDFEWVLKCSRADTVHVFLSCHRPSEVPVKIRAIADYWYVFHTTQPHDLDALGEHCSADMAAQAAALTGSEYVCWDNARGELSAMRDPTAWYLELAPGRPLAPPVELDAP